MRSGAGNVACRGRIGMFARSSGTTSSRSKYIPLTGKSLKRCHLRGMADVVALYLAQNPSSRIFSGRTLTLGGSCSREQGRLVGDLSGLLLQNTRYAGRLRMPSFRTALLDDFDRKCEAIVGECVGSDITAFAGVPSWNLALMRRVLEHTGKSDLREVWPHVELFMHGGVSFAPYRKAFEELIPSGEMHYVETYNASEGFFAIADDERRDDMLLMMDYGIYYEFRKGRRSAPVGGCRAGRRICSRDNDMRRAVAIRDRRRGKDYLRQTVQSKRSSAVRANISTSSARRSWPRTPSGRLCWRPRSADARSKSTPSHRDT